MAWSGVNIGSNEGIASVGTSIGTGRILIKIKQLDCDVVVFEYGFDLPDTPKVANVPNVRKPHKNSAVQVAA